jgi:hypothetical protein
MLQSLSWPSENYKQNYVCKKMLFWYEKYVQSFAYMQEELDYK